MSLLGFITTFFGCSKNISRPEAELSSVSISQNHMSQAYCYTFYAYRNSGSCFLDAWCMIEDGDDYLDVDFKGIEITEEEFKFFEELDSKYDFFSLVKDQNKKNKFFSVADETTSAFSVNYGDESFTLDTNGACYNEVCEHFFEIAKKYANSN